MILEINSMSKILPNSYRAHNINSKTKRVVMVKSIFYVIYIDEILNLINEYFEPQKDIPNHYNLYILQHKLKSVRDITIRSYNTGDDPHEGV